MRSQIPDRSYNPLFLCTGNSARSIFGEAILKKIGRGKFNAYSAGSDPKGTVNPYSLSLLRRLNYPTEGLRSKSWTSSPNPARQSSISCSRFATTPPMKCARRGRANR